MKNSGLPESSSIPIARAVTWISILGGAVLFWAVVGWLVLDRLR